MKVAVTYDEEELIFQHFGHTEHFKLYDIENGEVVSTEVVDIPAGGLLLVYACIVNKKPANKQKGRRLFICVTFISV